MAVKKVRTTYGVGDRVTLRKDKAPKYALEQMEKNPQLYLEIKGKVYNGYQIGVHDPRQNNRIVNTWNLTTAQITKGTNKTVLIKAIESKQAALKKHVEETQKEISLLEAQVKLMDEINVENIDDLDLEYAIRISEKLNISLADAYQACMNDA